MKNIDINLYVYFENKQKFIYDFETYDSDVLFVLEKGEFFYIDEKGKRVTVTEGNVVYCPNGFTFRRTVVKSVNLHMIRFTSHRGLNCGTKMYFINNRMNEDLQMLKKLLLKSNLLDDDKKHYCADFVRELLCEEKTDKYPEPLCKILDYIDKNSHRTITNTELCSISFLSEPSVISLMKKYFHKTPNHYITYLRISKSQKMLIETDETIKNIAYSVGFSDNLYFCRVFKKETGVSPTEFRKMYSI